MLWRLYPQRRSPQCQLDRKIGNRVSSIAGLDLVAKMNIPAPVRNSVPFIQLIVSLML
jgi:hypothetical protein